MVTAWSYTPVFLAMGFLHPLAYLMIRALLRRKESGLICTRCACCCCAPRCRWQPHRPPPASGNSLSSDEFDGTALDAAKWYPRTGVRLWSDNRAANVAVGGGNLRIALKKEKSADVDYTSGGIISRQAFRYGYYEARIRMPRGRGWHTSFWMMKAAPLANAGLQDRYQEIDVVEQDSIDAHAYSANLHVYKPHFSYGHRRIATPDLARRLPHLRRRVPPRRHRPLFRRQTGAQPSPVTGVPARRPAHLADVGGLRLLPHHQRGGWRAARGRPVRLGALLPPRGRRARAPPSPISTSPPCSALCPRRRRWSTRTTTSGAAACCARRRPQVSSLLLALAAPARLPGLGDAFRGGACGGRFAAGPLPLPRCGAGPARGRVLGRPVHAQTPPCCAPVTNTTSITWATPATASTRRS